MKISDLKQPYRRMAEYLAERNINLRRNNKTFLLDAFDWDITNDLFWDDIDNGNYPEITEEIKTHFPADFDFSGEDESLNQKYTQLAKDGKFDDLPDTCEFSEPVELEVWDGVMEKFLKLISGKYRGLYMDLEFQAWDYAQLPTPKIDFTQFNNGDVVEVEYYGDEGHEKIVGYIYSQHDHSIHISSKMTCYGDEEIILNQNIRKITKIK